MSSTTARAAAITALTLACAAAAPAAWAGDKGHGHEQGAPAATHGSGPSSQDDGSHNPPGNNGTVKIHQLAGDTSPHNVPHVTCDFYITFFGFDTDQTADVSLAGQAPTGKGTALWSKDDELISSDDAGGGQDVDNEIHVTAAELGLDRLGAPHPKQGYHLKLDVDVNGAPGAAKHKVFWLQPCESAGGEVQGVTGGSSNVVGGTSTGTSTTGTTPPAVLGETVHRTPATPAVKVLGESLTRSPATTGTSVLGTSTGLPFTGAPLIGLLGAAGAAAGAGALMLRAGRRRESTA